MDVLDSVKKISNANIDDCVMLANKMIPKLGDTLASQHGKHYGFGNYT